MLFFFSSRRRHTRCALVTGVQTCALPIFAIAMCPVDRLAEVVDCPALAGFASDRWFADRDAIKAVLRDHLATQATRYWLDRLEPAGIWAAPVNDWPAFTADPAFAALEATQQEIGRAHV